MITQNQVAGPIAGKAKADRTLRPPTDNFPEGDELIFHERNKAYGAYQIRRAYPQSILKGIGVAVAIALLLIILPWLWNLIFPPPRFSDELKAGEGRSTNVSTLSEPPALQAEKSAAPAAKISAPPIIKEHVSQAKDTVVSTNTAPDNPDKSATGTANPNPGNGSSASNNSIPPSFPGGTERMNEFIRQNLDYPVEEFAAHRKGTVWIIFLVGADGVLKDIRVDKSISPGLDAEALRIIRLMPEWSPGIQNGKAVEGVPVRVPVPFRLGY